MSHKTLTNVHLFIDTILEQLDKWLNANNAADF